MLIVWTLDERRSLSPDGSWTHRRVMRKAMDRRVFFAVTIPGAAGLGIWVYSELFPSESDIPPPGPPKIVSIVEFSDSGSRIGTRAVLQILKSDREWRRQLTYPSFQVTRKSATEIAYTA